MVLIDGSWKIIEFKTDIDDLDYWTMLHESDQSLKNGENFIPVVEKRSDKLVLIKARAIVKIFRIRLVPDPNHQYPVQDQEYRLRKLSGDYDSDMNLGI